MLTYSDKSIEVQKISEEERKKKERMRDVFLLLQQLVEREEVTLKLIIDCLYDVGSINLVNKKFHKKPLNRFMKAIATMSKPFVRIVALRWVKKKLPILVTNWLERKVSPR
ncbi:MAG: hypothetical protein QNJ41_09115 [Xenococcaceae cyanobacterium MO_188.B32]|nr:hypothetical protein [Xenococcaceae cyanobacterium MO_188.B32]